MREEEVESFVYLKNIITTTVRCDNDVRKKRKPKDKLKG
jgi:hypothetical protein